MKTHRAKPNRLSVLAVRPWSFNVLLALLLLLFTRPAAVHADQDGDFGYTTDGHTVTITNYTGPGGDLAIPATIIGRPVVAIGNRAFYGHLGLTALTIPDSVTNIGTYVFATCYNLTAVTIPDSVTSLGQMAFYYCSSLHSLALPNGLTAIADWTFAYNRNLTRLTLPATVTTIGTHAFYGIDNYLTTLVLPGSVQSIGASAFANCANLTSVFFKGNAPSLATNVFDADHRTTVYYLPGTAGWGPTFGDRPTALWLPRIHAAAVQAGQFSFRISWAEGLTVAVDGATNLTSPSWVPLQTNTLTDGSVYFSDPMWMNYPGRFYRLRSP